MQSEKLKIIVISSDFAGRRAEKSLKEVLEKGIPPLATL